MAATPDGGGYWLVASDGGIFNYGDAGFFGSTRRPAPQLPHRRHGHRRPTASGYWLVAADGGIFTYGDASFFGSAGSIHLNKPIVGMARASERDRLLVGRLRRRHLQLWQCTLPGLHGRHARWSRPSSAMAAVGERLPARRVRWRRLQLRHRFLRIDGGDRRSPIRDPHCGDARRCWLLAPADLASPDAAHGPARQHGRRGLLAAVQLYALGYWVDTTSGTSTTAPSKRYGPCRRRPG